MMVHDQDSLVHLQDQEKDDQVQEPRAVYKTDEVEGKLNYLLVGPEEAIPIIINNSSGNCFTGYSI